MTDLGSNALRTEGQSRPAGRDDVYIGGAFVPSASAGRCRVVDPATEELIGEVPGGSAIDVDRAVGAARAAFDDGASRTVHERAAALAGLGELIDASAAELVELIVSEVGVTLAWARDVHVGRLAAGIAGLLGLADQVPPPEQIRQSLVVREPAGVVASMMLDAVIPVTTSTLSSSISFEAT